MGTIEHAYGFDVEKGQKDLWLPGKGKWKRVQEMTLTPVTDVWGKTKGIAICHPEGNVYTTHGPSAVRRMVAILSRYLVVMEKEQTPGHLVPALRSERQLEQAARN